ncbi:MAG: hypothetical protein AB7U73_17380 [Pirellulales bacterium]
MAEQPKRRWFQFRLSTWFVLVAIVACAMTPLPHYFLTTTLLFAAITVAVIACENMSANPKIETGLASMSTGLMLVQFSAYAALVVYTRVVRIARLEWLIAFVSLELILFVWSTLLLFATASEPTSDRRSTVQIANLAVLATTSRVMFEFLTMRSIDL